ncbi:sensor histidine kinase [Geoalkalibacter sp.]|uniref:sensor histidine kinase n=1 Tax=Geoalkalibacter sp. TaxID=3041440 RepID=UPI00272E8C3E|nr:GAF domain-containing sensor histidine kinase [Geoalkalibacter sp.]
MGVQTPDLLRQVMQVLGAAEVDFSNQARAVLQVLVAQLPLSAASIQLCDPQRGQRPLILRSSTAVATEGKAGGLSVSPGWHPLHEGGTLALPLSDSLPPLGLLCLHGLATPDLLAPWQADLGLIRGHLARLLRGELLLRQERRDKARLQFLAELSRRINQAQSLRQMVSELLGTLVREGKVVFAAVHPSETDPLLLSPQSELLSDYRSGRAALQQLARNVNAQVLEARQTVQREAFEEEELRHLNLPFRALGLPLLFQQQLLGSLVIVTQRSADSEDGAAPGVDAPFFCDLAVQVAEAWGRISAMQNLARVSRDKDRKLREISFLYQISQAMHGTRGLDELVHYILSVTVLPQGPGCERAMLFMVNERSRFLQGMLAVTRDQAEDGWAPPLCLHESGHPLVPRDIQATQQNSALSRMVRQQRLPLDDALSPLARAARTGQVILAGAGDESANTVGDLRLGTYLCVPLRGRDRVLAVLLTDNCESALQFDDEDRHFLELFASQAGAAMESAMLVQQLKNAHHELRAAQENLLQTEKLATLGEFAASVAHELKNPLVCVGGFAQRLLKQIPPGTPGWDYAEIIAREVRRVEDMLNNILSFSKRRMMCFEECNIIEVIASALSLVSRELTEADISIHQEFLPDLPPIVGDAAQLRQVLINLLTNARDAMGEGGTLSIRAYSSTLRGDPAITVEVADTGGGIAPEVLRNIFNPFFTTKDSGTGLGLPICHRIMEHHRGILAVFNNGQGATFSLQIPQARKKNQTS